jgi:hypothetical protein
MLPCMPHPSTSSLVIRVADAPYAIALTREARRTIAAYLPERPRYPKAVEGAEAVVGRLRLAFTAESLSPSSARC